MASSFRDRFPAPVRLEAWTVHPRLNRLDGPDGEITIEPRLMDVLLCLAASAGEVLTRDELLDRVWGDVVVGEEALTRAVSELRRILGDDSRQPRYIQTIRKGGYRLICQVAEAETADETAGETAEPQTESPYRASP